MTVKFLTLGCKVNQYETQAVAAQFEAAGFDIVDGSQAADIIIINSCTVTSSADKKTRQLVRRIRREQPTAVIALTGCLPQAAPEIGELLTEADVITGANNRQALLGCIRQHLATSRAVIDISPHLPGQSFEPMAVSDHAGHRRAFIKIQDGCDRYCSYCIIPTARGPLRSKPTADIIREAEELVGKGFKELVLVGINLGMYGVDLGLSLPDGVAAACCPKGEYRVRLGSVEPDLLGDAVLNRLAALPRLCPHFHLPLQSGCDATLWRMNRHYNTAQYLDTVNKIRHIWGGLTAISTDIMVGFPGEDEAEFAKTLDFASSIAFSDAHIFEFSPRRGTAAADMVAQVEPAAKSHRAAALSRAIKASAESYAAKQIGTSCKVLVENCGNAGHNERYTYVLLPDCKNLAGQLLDVEITAAKGVQCIGRILGEQPPK